MRWKKKEKIHCNIYMFFLWHWYVITVDSEPKKKTQLKSQCQFPFSHVYDGYKHCEYFIADLNILCCIKPTFKPIRQASTVECRALMLG